MMTNKAVLEVIWEQLSLDMGLTDLRYLDSCKVFQFTQPMNFSYT